MIRRDEAGQFANMGRCTQAQVHRAHNAPCCVDHIIEFLRPIRCHVVSDVVVTVWKTIEQMLSERRIVDERKLFHVRFRERS